MGRSHFPGVILQLLTTMPDPLKRTLDAVGVTPWQIIIGVLSLGFYFGSVKPLLDSLPTLTAAVKEVGVNLADLRSDVKVHEVLLLGLQEVKKEQGEMRRELSTIEGKLAHVKFYGGAEP